MSNRCCAPRCTNSNKNRYALTKLGEDPQLRQKWIDAVGKPNWQPPKLAVLCEVHFHPSAVYCVGKRKFISKNAAPTFFCKCDIIDEQNLINHHYSLRSRYYTKKSELKLKREKKSGQFMHNKNCCIKQSPLDIKISDQSIKAGCTKEQKIKLKRSQINPDYETIPVKLNNIMQENEVLKERIHCLQDDLMHLKSFRFDIMH
ncbi:THAP domain-containing protein 2-like isoform X1 [Monomorium pharaonis]|uniref:THAP domain-containing protein 2-like isoform X1 n=1 Tax=Monomorium pharaonis TaxID=307658 RepID=UPI00174627B0|nr:THAP domain-containing protein 2-like isoform X1 [Monomorium pharaonis]XP_036148193.1 THAP domain-containing protein 2-like isoform X1 [Monomorium pharaonis]